MKPFTRNSSIMNTRKAFLMVAATAGCGIGCLLAADQPLPWEREISLREAAKSVALTEKLNPTSPLPSGEYFGGAAMSINNLKLRTTLWGPPDRVTISINKNNVWDRRVAPRAFTAPTLQEVIDGANSPANKDYVGRARTEQRPKEYGYLHKEGGSYDAWRQPIEYPFPCLKPVGQIIIGMDAFRGIQPPTASQSCANGLVTLSETNGEAQATLQYVLGMTNEIFTTSRFVRNWPDSEDMWKQLVEYWTPGAQQNAREMFGMPGMFITHGYLPPIKPDKYVHTTITLEFCLGTMAQMIRPAWDEWDYGGDLNFLRNECYPMMKQMALFYAAYAKKGEDGNYHVIPSMEEERWGFYPQLARNKDVISSLCLFRWALTRAAEAAELLGVDADLRQHWRDVAAPSSSPPAKKRAVFILWKLLHAAACPAGS